MNVSCCFCGTRVESNDVNPCEVNVLKNWDKPRFKQHDQSFWCHLECFKERMHIDLQQHLLIHLLSDKKE